MARRRMFSLDVVDTDAFLDMPCSAQCLYFHLGMRADDDGFVSSPKRVASIVNASGNDLRILVSKGYVIPFDSGVCVIKDWKVNNYLRSDRYTPTRYLAEKSSLETINGVYLPSGIPNGIPSDNRAVDNRDTQYRLGKDSINYISADEPQTPAPKSEATKEDKKRTQFAPPTLDEVQAYCTERGNGVDAEAFLAYYEANGWRVGRNKMKDWKASVRYWERNAVGSSKPKAAPAPKPTAPKRSYTTADLVEYPPGSGNYIPADHIPGGSHAV